MKSRYSACATVIAVLLALVLVSPTLPHEVVLADQDATTSKINGVSASMEHMIGGFNLDRPSSAIAGQSLGLRDAIRYSYSPPGSGLASTYRSLHLHQIDGQLWVYLYAYECHRTLTLHLKPRDTSAYCTTEADPTMDYSKLMASVASHLQQVRFDSSISGYWVLDDWPTYDASASPLLNAIHALIKRYNPERPALCGFGGFITKDTYEWRSELVNNFSSSGCDTIALYVYTDSETTMPTANEYDWSMHGLMDRVKSDFRARGWDASRTPLMGIAQTFGGRNRYNGSYVVYPTRRSIATQSKAFCAAGASSIAFYSWNLYEYRDYQTPLNNPALAHGVRDGIAACKTIWHEPALIRAQAQKLYGGASPRHYHP